MRTALLVACVALLAGVGLAQDSLYVRLVGRWGAGQTNGVAVDGGYAYVAGLSDAIAGLHVISIADPSNPSRVGVCSTLAVPRGVAVSGEYAYYADDVAGLRVISISDPTRPFEVGRCTTRAAYGVTVRGDHAYVIDSAGLSVVSIADPHRPVEVGYGRKPPGWQSWWHVEVVGDYAYVAAGGGGLRVISIIDPTHPTEVGSYEPGAVTGLALSDGRVFIGGDSNFRVVSVADPAHPVEIGRLDSVVMFPTAIAVTHGYAFVANQTSAALQVVSIADPTRPCKAGHYSGAYGWDVVADGDYVYHCASGLRIYQFYQLGDLDIDSDSLDVAADTLRLRRWTTVPSTSFRLSDGVAIGGISTEKPRDSQRVASPPWERTLGVTVGAGAQFECAYAEFILANTSASYNPDSIDGPSVSPVDSLRCTGTLTGPGGTIDSFVIPNMPAMLAQGQTMVCTLAAYVPVGFSDGDYTGSIYVSGKDTADLQVYESCYVLVRKLGDLDIDNDSLDVVADTIRMCPRLASAGPPLVYTEFALGEFLLTNTSESYNPDTADGPSHSTVRSLRFTAALAGPRGTIDSIFIRSLPESLVLGQAMVCTLAAYVPPELPDGDYSGPVVISRSDTLEPPLAETVYALVTKLGDLDVDHDSLDVAGDTMSPRLRPVYVPSGMARFMLANTSQSYNPDAADGPSHSPLREFKVEAEVEGQNGTLDSIYVLNLPESLAVGQAVECTLALVLRAGATPDDYGGWVFISAMDSLGFSAQDSFAVVVKGAEPHQSLDSLRVAPIPFKPNQNPEHDAIHFQGLSAGARVTVYDASGQSVWSATEQGDGHLKWDAKVASGIYVYLVVSADGKSSKVGKLSVIR